MLAAIGDVAAPDHLAALLAVDPTVVAPASASSFPSPPPPSSWALQLEQQEGALYARLHDAAVGGGGGVPVTAPSATAGQGEPAAAAAGGGGGADTDRDARCRGACVLLSISLPLWRVAFRQPRGFAGMLHAVLASRAYNTTPVQVRYQLCTVCDTFNPLCIPLCAHPVISCLFRTLAVHLNPLTLV